MTALLPPEALRNHVAVLGKTGSGKTSTAKRLVEDVVASGARVCVLDPLKSDWRGLVSSADGTRPGLPFVILGGPWGALPLSADAGAALGALVARGDLPLSVLDLADFGAGETHRFFAAFAEALFRSMTGVLWLVVEEAHEFAPKERSGLGDENMALHWAKKLASAGRSKGLRLLVSSQRLQKLHNDFWGSAETLFVHRLTAPADQDAVVKWAKANAGKARADEVAADLARLKTGTAWVMSGEAGIFERRAIPKFSTYDNAATPDGENASEVATARVDVERLKAVLGAAVAEAQANDPKALRAEIAALKKSLAERASAKPADEAFSVGRAQGAAEMLGKVRQILREALQAARDSFDDFILQPSARPSDVSGIVAEATRHGLTSLHEGERRQASSEQKAPVVNARAGDAAALGPERRPLQILVDRAPAAFTEAQWATLAGMKRTGGTWQTYRSRLRVAGMIEQEGGRWRATPAALEALPRRPLDADPLEQWRRSLGAGPSRLIDALVEHGRLDRKSLAEAVGIEASGGTFGTYLSRLTANGVVEKVGETYRLAEVPR